MKFETLRELEAAVKAICPTAEVCEDNYGQITIYTGLVEKNGKLEQFILGSPGQPEGEG